MKGYVFLWETLEGERRWEVIGDGQTKGFLRKLIESGKVHPASIMVAFNPIFFHWVFKQFHRGLSCVHFSTVDEEIMGHEPVAESRHEPVDVPAEKRPESKYGWLAPDGRYFQCEYGCHSSLARNIVGEIQHITDAERHLEDLGWAKVLSGTYSGTTYAVGMGDGKRLTDAQIRTLQREELDGAAGVHEYL